MLPPVGPWTRRPPTAVLGLDIGGVLVDRVAEGEDTSFFGSRPMETPAVLGAFEAVAELVELFEGRVHIVSKAGPRIASLSRAWLSVNGLVGEGMIAPEKVHFVGKRWDKAPVCADLADHPLRRRPAGRAGVPDEPCLTDCCSPADSAGTPRLPSRRRRCASCPRGRRRSGPERPEGSRTCARLRVGASRATGRGTIRWGSH